MGRLKRLWRQVFAGMQDQSQYQADSQLLTEYEDLCTHLGADSEEARSLAPRVQEIEDRREKIFGA